MKLLKFNEERCPYLIFSGSPSNIFNETNWASFDASPIRILIIIMLYILIDKSYCLYQVRFKPVCINKTRILQHLQILFLTGRSLPKQSAYTVSNKELFYKRSTTVQFRRFNLPKVFHDILHKGQFDYLKFTFIYCSFFIFC